MFFWDVMQYIMVDKYQKFRTFVRNISTYLP
jgi:hypothetical protein